MTSSILSPPYQQPPMMHSYAAHPPPPPPPGRFIGSTTPRYGMTHATNSAHSASANPDEDWTKISDLAERRRIQNRIAQRNYRKKLKRRLEDLERRASSTSPPPGNGSLPSQHDLAGIRRRPSKPGPMPARKRSPNPGAANTFTPNANDYLYARRDSRQPSITPPPSMTYSAGSTTTSPSMPSVFQHQAPHQPQGAPFAPFSGAYSDPSYGQPILPPPASLGLNRGLPNPSEPWQASKPAGYGEDDMFGQFGMSGSYPATSAAPYEPSGVSTGYPEQSIYSNQPLGY